MSLPLTGAGPSKGSPFPIEINFDGDESQFFDGGWSEVGGNVLNDQIVLGSELVTNGDFANWTSDDPDNWTVAGEVGADPEISEVASGESHADAPTLGGGFVSMFTSGDAVSLLQAVTSIGLWHQWSILADTDVAGNLRLLCGPLFAIVNGVGTKTGAFRSGSAIIDISRDGPTDYTFDDFSIKQSTLISLLNALKSQFGLSDGFFIDVHINAVTADTQVGVIWNYDGSNNFGMAYMDGTNLIVDKNVAGTYSNLASVAQAVTPDQILRIENPAGTNVLDIKYNGVSKATPTISDAGIISNTGIALFSTEENNAISKVTIGRL